MCLQRSPSVARWPSAIRRRAAGNAISDKCCDIASSSLLCVVQHGCVVNAPPSATTAPRARPLAAACLALAALALAARCYAASPTGLHHQLSKRQAPPAPDNVTASDDYYNVSTQNVNVNSARVSDSTSRPMPLHEPHDKHPTHTVSGGASQHPDIVERSSGGGGGGSGGLLALVVGAALLSATLGLITCVVSHYRGGGGGGGSAGGAPPPPPPPPPHHALSPHHHHHHYITAPMLSVMSASAAAGVGVAAAAAGDGGRLHRHRELAAQRDRQVRLHSVHTDLELDLPPSIALPDGEELPYGSSARLHIRDPEQESEIYQKCIRAPPNRTVFESESPPPYRSSSAGLLGSLGSSSSSGASDWSAGSTPLVVRCHSMSSSKPHQHQHQHPTSTQKTDFLQRTVKILTGRKSSHSQQPAPAPTLPAVVVPARPRRLDPRAPHV